MVSSPSMHPLQPSSSNITSMKMIKTIIHTLVASRMFHVTRLLLTRLKSIVKGIIKDIKFPKHGFIYSYKTTKEKQRNRIFFGSFRLHYNWCESSRKSVIISSNDHQGYENRNSYESCELSRYLQWLEMGEKGNVNEIDRLADKYIASCHEKFRLEKEESLRKFQEMLARSI